MFPMDWICNACGDNNAVSDATATFDRATGEWVLSDLWDGTWCNTCSNEGDFSYAPFMVEIQLMGDQPVTCPDCGSRTGWNDLEVKRTADQLHYCLNHECGTHFRVSEK